MHRLILYLVFFKSETTLSFVLSGIQTHNPVIFRHTVNITSFVYLSLIDSFKGIGHETFIASLNTCQLPLSNRLRSYTRAESQLLISSFLHFLIYLIQSISTLQEFLSRINIFHNYTVFHYFIFFFLNVY